MRRLNIPLIVCLAALLGCGGSAAVHPPAAARAQSLGVNNAELKGDYAFNLTGFTASATAPTIFSAVGRFTADGAGNLTSGELDTNGAGSAAALVAQTFTGTYSISADHRGVMTLTTAQGASSKLAFAMTAAGNAQVIEFDAAGGTGTVASGTIDKADTTAYSTAKITGNYAFGIRGFDPTNRSVTFVGRLTADGTGNFANGAADINASDAAGPATFTTANYTVSDTANGRGTINFSIIFSGKPFSLTYVFYIVNSGKIFLMGRDAVATTAPLLSGTMLQQQSPAGGFSDASLNGSMVLYLTTLTVCVTNAVPDVVAGLLTADGMGGITLSYDRNCGGVISSAALSGTYSATNDGRAAITVGTVTMVAYLANLDQAFFVVTNASAFFGFSEPQATGPFTNNAVLGNYAGATTLPAPSSAVTFSGEFTADAASPAGNITGTEDTSGASGPVSAAAFNGTYSIASSPIDGRGTMTITSGTGGSAVLYVVSPSKFIAIPLSDPNPAVWTFEQASAPSTPTTISSLTLNPTSVVGGAQSSTGTVTLSGPAPTGGAVVSLSSSNPSVAAVPASVTVPAGASSASFAVTTAAVVAPTTVTISASYGGTSTAASLTVTPPGVTLSSLTLSPTSVIGGTQSSTGTVTLSGPAPTGGAVVSLSSSSPSVAAVPASVTVPAGASGASFTVTTGAVAASTTVTISASYGGASTTASFTVTPPGVTLSSLTLSPTSVIGGTQSSTGTVTLSGPAPSGGAFVSLSSSNPGVAAVPASVTVPAGAGSVSFTAATSAVVSSTAVTISGSYGGVSRSASLTVTPVAVSLSSLTLSPTSVIGGTQSSTGTVTLSGPAPSGGAVVSLSSSNPGAAAAPASVTVPAGAGSASFTVTTGAVAASTTVTISASFGGASRTASLTVTPPPVALSALTLSPTSVTGGTQSSTGTVTLSGPAPTGGAVVSLSSSNPGAAAVPSSVTVAAGGSSASFTVTTGAVAASTTVTISASFGGANRTGSLTVTPPQVTLSSLTLNPSSVIGGVQSSTGTVTLSGPAPAGGTVVSLSSSSPGLASVPSSVTIPAGATSASFTVNTSIVLISTSVNISASYNGTTRTATLSLLL